MKILAIETSCDETALALIEVTKKTSKREFTTLGNALSSQIALHQQYGGVFPAMAKREHQKNIIPIFIEVLTQAQQYKKKIEKYQNTEIDTKITAILDRERELLSLWNETLPFIEKPDIDAIVVTTGPGLEPTLWVGINFAQALSVYWNIPLIPVNHMEGHIFSIFPNQTHTFTIDTKEKLFPMISLLVSGGHTEIVLVKEWMNYDILGQTRDDAVGEAFDKVARMLDLPYPGGPQISKLAETERQKNPEGALTLPRPMITSKNYDFSFSGLKTAVLYHIRDNPISSDSQKAPIARAFEDAAIDVLVTKTMRALKTYKAKALIVGGGVSANIHLQKTLTEKIQKENPSIKLFLPSKGLSTDNGLMIAIAGYFQWERKNRFFSKLLAKIRTKKKLVANGNLSL